MSRIIEFRAWNKYNNTMYSMESVEFACNEIWKLRTLELNDEFIVMQYTGLKDKNGTKIFEGDILSNGDYVAQVVFGEFDGLMAWHVLINHKKQWALGSGDILGHNPYIEVIGNIYENPELIKGDL